MKAEMKAKLQSEIDTCVDRIDWWHHEIATAAQQHDKEEVLYAAERLVWWHNQLLALQAVMKETT